MLADRPNVCLVGHAFKKGHLDRHTRVKEIAPYPCSDGRSARIYTRAAQTTMSERRLRV